VIFTTLPFVVDRDAGGLEARGDAHHGLRVLVHHADVGLAVAVAVEVVPGVALEEVVRRVVVLAELLELQVDLRKRPERMRSSMSFS
jgi:hypothetical protein